MNKYSQLFIVLIVSLLCASSLHARLFDGLIVSNTGDTVMCQLNVKVSLFNKKLINSLSCKRKLKVVHGDGYKKTYYPNEIQSFVIFNTSEGNMTYESHMVYNEHCFMQVIQKEPIELYKYYYPHAYDGASSFYYTVRKAGGDFIMLAPLRWRTQLKNNFPEDEYFLREKKEKNSKYKNIPEFLKNYKNKTTTNND